MNKAAETVYGAIRHDGHQRNVITMMQTREELYERIGYHEFERSLDKVFSSAK
jgi:methylisocitrate lyase